MREDGRRVFRAAGAVRAAGWGLLAAVLWVGGCAVRVPPTTAAAPHYPDFVFPAVPDDLQQPELVRQQEAGWRWLQAGDLRRSEREFSAALTRSSTFFPAEAALGYVALARRDYADAVARFGLALERRETYVPALVGRGEALLALKREPEALASFEAALRADPALVDVQSRIEVLRFRAAQEHVTTARRAAEAGRYTEAVQAYERALAASPDSAFLYRDLAAIEIASGQAEAALEHLTRAIALDPADGASQARIAEISEARGELEAALAAYTAAMTLAPDEATRARIADLRARIALARLPPQYQAIAQSAPLTRGELAALIGVRFEGLLETAQGQTAVLVTDGRGHWASPWIMAVVRAGVMDPFPNHAFAPADVVRRGDLAHAAGRLLAIIGTAQPALSARWREERPKMADVDAGNLRYADAALAVAAGVMTLGGDGTFQLSRPVSGAEAIEVVGRIEALARGPAGARPGPDARGGMFPAGGIPWLF